MSADLLREIKSFNAEGASVLRKAKFQTDAELRTLTREDLSELFPGNGKLKVRKRIFEIIHKEKPVSVLLQELNGFISQDTSRASLSGSGLLVDYLHNLKELKTQMCNVQMFLDAHIEFLENLSKNPEQQCGKGPPNYPGPMSHMRPTEIYQSGAEVVRVTCLTIVYGDTFGVERQLLDKMRAPSPGQPQLQLIEDDRDFQVIIVFCKTYACVEAEVAVAMYHAPGGFPVILVLMHDVHGPGYTKENENFGFDNIKMQVNVSLHESTRGILPDRQNYSAVSAIRNKLLDFGVWSTAYGESRASAHGKQSYPWW